MQDARQGNTDGSGDAGTHLRLAALTALSILRLYALSPADLFFKWEAFLLSTASAASKNNAGGSSSSSSMKNNQVLAFNLENLRQLKKEIQMSTGSAAAAPGTVKREHQQQQGSNGSAMAANRVKKLGGRAALDGMQVASSNYSPIDTMQD
jgi:hypothetical protein